MSGCECTDADRAAFAETAFVGWIGRLVRDHRGYLLRLARREGLGGEDAFDVVQEAFQTFLTLPAAQSLVDVPEDSRRLLSVVTRNAARNRRRLAAVARTQATDTATFDALPSQSANVEELLATAEEELRLRGCVAELGERQRAVVTLRMLEEFDGDDVARTLGITPQNVAVLLHRAKANLVRCMTSQNT
jgi:RNA polymerase sigma-70 factor (ECF subfamily)